MRYKLSLRLFSKHFKAAEITAQITWRAKITQSIGDLRNTPKGQPLVGLYDETYCLFEITHDSKESLEDCVSRVLEEISPFHKLISEIRAHGGRAEFFVGWFAESDGGFSLDNKIISLLVSSGIDFVMAIYSSE